MELREAVKQVRKLKLHAADIVQDMASFEQAQESMVLLKILAQSKKSIKQGRYKPVKKSFADLSKRIAATV